MAGYTPMLRQYIEIKQKYKDCILFFRLGDFYEMFFDDAIYAAEVLDIVLTARDGGKGQKVPMCGVPYHAVEQYLVKLIELGKKVAICEQVEDPKKAKGLVKRDVIKVITPGTYQANNFIGSDQNNYLLALCRTTDWGYSYVDISTGEFYYGILDGAASIDALLDTVLMLSPSEIILGQVEQQYASFMQVLENKRVLLTIRDILGPERARELLLEQLPTLDERTLNAGILAAARLLDYLKDTQKGLLPQLTSLTRIEPATYLMIDAITKRNLELTETMRGGKKRGSLFWALDQTKTAMGSRCLRRWILKPLKVSALINRRLNVVKEFVANTILLQETRQILTGIKDLERMLGQIAAGKAHAQLLKTMASSFQKITELEDALSVATSPLLLDLRKQLHGLEPLLATLQRALADDPPLTTKEGSMIKAGYDEEVDRLRSLKEHGHTWIAQLEQTERLRTGIKSLKIKYNRVFGYYLEVTKANLQYVPSDYQRKQTLANCERYVTPELKEKEVEILTANEKLYIREYEIFQELVSEVLSQAALIQQIAQALASIDVLTTFAENALHNDYCMPLIHDGYEIRLTEGRHPVIEQVSKERSFVPNDMEMNQNSFFHIITGPNMSGKSTYMRQVALIILMAQMGSFVPAAQAEIGVVDRLFTRVGAADDIFTGQSTFMVEMNEVANICHKATEQSFVILDEIGRGTSTYDGMSIARAVTEYLHNKVHCKTLFATHYHELTSLEQNLAGVKNYSIAVHEEGKDIVFLRRMVEGAANRSYGIHVCRLAGVPEEVIEAAENYLEHLTETGLPDQKSQGLRVKEKAKQLDIFNNHPIITELKQLELQTMTPLQALTLLYKWQNAVKR